MRTLVRFMIAALLACSLASCAWLPQWSWQWPFSPPKTPASLVGTWKHRSGALWTIRDDRTFEVDINRDDVADATGTYRLRGPHMITISNTGGEALPGCEWPGVYRYKVQKDKLSLVAVEDACMERVVLLSAASWRRR
jgi:hypothetical protein